MSNLSALIKSFKGRTDFQTGDESDFFALSGMLGLLDKPVLARLALLEPLRSKVRKEQDTAAYCEIVRETGDIIRNDNPSNTTVSEWLACGYDSEKIFKFWSAQTKEFAMDHAAEVK